MPKAKRLIRHSGIPATFVDIVPNWTAGRPECEPVGRQRPGNAYSDGVPAEESQKTLRLLIVVVSALALGFYAIYSLNQHPGQGGKVEVDLPKGRVSLSLNQPIVDQAGVARSKTKDGDIEYTKGRIDNPGLVAELNNLGSSEPTQFSGKNFINRDAGFVFTVEHPELWMIRYNPAGMSNSNIPVNTIYNAEGASLNVGVSSILPNITIQQFVSMSVQFMMRAGAIYQQPQISYDQPSETAFAVFTNPFTRGQSYQKVIIDRRRGRVFVVSANYNQSLSSPNAVQDLVGMISSFTLIGE